MVVLMKTLIAIALCSILGGCVVVPGHPHGGPPGHYKSKKHGHARGHHHGGKCGHKRRLHEGRYVYFVGGRWCTSDGVVVVIKG